MPKARKSANMWYARAQQFRALAEALPGTLDRADYPGESKFQIDERVDVLDLTRRRLLRESERCWAEGGRVEVEAKRRKEEAHG